MNKDLMKMVKVAFQDCSSAELMALVDPVDGLASRCSWPPTLNDIAVFRKARREKLGEQADFERRHGGAPDKPVSDQWRAHKQERLLLAKEVWPDAWIDWSQDDQFGDPGAIVSSSHRIQLARIRQRQDHTLFRPYPKLWEAFINEPEVIRRLETELMTFGELTQASKLLAMRGIDEAREYITGKEKQL